MTNIQKFIDLYEQQLHEFKKQYYFTYEVSLNRFSYHSYAKYEKPTQLHTDSLALYLKALKKTLLTQKATFKLVDQTKALSSTFISSYIPNFITQEHLGKTLINDSLNLLPEELNIIQKFCMPIVSLYEILRTFDDSKPYSEDEKQKALFLFTHWKTKYNDKTDINLDIVNIREFYLSPELFKEPLLNYLNRYKKIIIEPCSPQTHSPFYLQGNILSLVKSIFPVNEWRDFAPFISDLYEPHTPTNEPLIAPIENHVSLFKVDYNSLKNEHIQLLTNEDLQSILKSILFINEAGIGDLKQIKIYATTNQHSIFTIESNDSFPVNPPLVTHIIKSVIDEYSRQQFNSDDSTEKLTNFFVPFIKSCVLEYKLPNKQASGTKFKI
jgi:hypothetical protein